LVDREKLVKGYVLLVIFDLAYGMRAGEKAVEIASSKNLDLLVAYVFKKKTIESMSTPSVRRGVGDHLALIYSFSEKGFQEELKEANQVLEKILQMAGDKNIKAKTLHGEYVSLHSLVPHMSRADYIVIGYSHPYYTKITERIKKLFEEKTILVA
jgi:hypothetical protein